MKNLLESCLALIDSAGDMFAMPADNWEAEASRVRSAVRTALAALEPGATPAEVILAQADRLEDEGDWKAETTRLLFTEPLDVARVLTSIKVEAGEGYCSITKKQPGNYVISGITFDKPGDVTVAWTIPGVQGGVSDQQP